MDGEDLEVLHDIPSANQSTEQFGFNLPRMLPMSCRMTSALPHLLYL